MNIKDKIYKAYCLNGMTAAVEVADKADLLFLHCPACNTETPCVENECVICGQTYPQTITCQWPDGTVDGPWTMSEYLQTNTRDKDVEHIDPADANIVQNLAVGAHHYIPVHCGYAKITRIK